MGLQPTSNEATGQIRRNPEGGRSFSPRLRCSLLTDPLRDMLVAHASSGRKIPCRERHRIYASDHLAASVCCQRKTRNRFRFRVPTSPTTGVPAWSRRTRAPTWFQTRRILVLLEAL